MSPLKKLSFSTQRRKAAKNFKFYFEKIHRNALWFRFFETAFVFLGVLASSR